jgi:hypothetical protein
LSRTVIPNEVYTAVKEGPVPGVVPSIERQPDGNNLVTLRKPSVNPMTGALTKDNQPGTEHAVPQEMVTRMFTNLPAEIRRTARERFAELIKRIWTDAQTSFYLDGQIRWPKSIQNEIAVLGLAQGKPDLAKQVDALARHFIVKGARQQQEADRKRISIDWHGHLSA